ncbi:MAG: MerR family transcriptional regulator [Firmicutes bacterium]|nr:MerR family transcriptional regulator [Bacillota bacterium]
MKYYTLDEVASLTKINKRTLKYYVERKIIVPSSMRNEGKKKYWLYTESDITNIKQIALYRELNYSADSIKKIISEEDFDWNKALNEQIDELRARKKHLENLIFAAEMMRYYSESEPEEDPAGFDISDFDNDIDSFADSMLISNEDQLAKDSLTKFSDDLAKGLDISDIQKHGQEVTNLVIQIRDRMNQPPSSEKVQKSIDDVFRYLSSLSDGTTINPSDVLFGIRLISNISIDRMFDVIFSKEGSADFVLEALKIYCNRKKEN